MIFQNSFKFKSLSKFPKFNFQQLSACRLEKLSVNILFKFSRFISLFLPSEIFFLRLWESKKLSFKNFCMKHDPLVERAFPFASDKTSVWYREKFEQMPYHCPNIDCIKIMNHEKKQNRSRNVRISVFYVRFLLPLFFLLHFCSQRL